MHKGSSCCSVISTLWIDFCDIHQFELDKTIECESPQRAEEEEEDDD